MMPAEFTIPNGKVEFLDPAMDAQVAECIAHLHDTVQRFFAVPAHLLREQDLIDFKISAMRQAEPYQRQIAHLIALHARPRILIGR